MAVVDDSWADILARPSNSSLAKPWNDSGRIDKERSTEERYDGEKRMGFKQRMWLLLSEQKKLLEERRNAEILRVRTGK